MNKQLMQYHQKRISFTVEGEGDPLVFLHGFMESSEIWNDFITELSSSFRVIAIDLPGHGDTELMDEVHTMEMMADVVYHVLTALGVSTCFLTGHSMGGYVALEFASKHEKMIRGLCLFHSNAYNDSPEARLNRTRAISIVRQNRTTFTTSFIHELFAPRNRVKFAPAIRELQERASTISSDSIVAAMEGMKVRRCHYDTLKALNVPVLFIIGQLDSRIDMTRMLEQILLPADATVLLLRDCGHMGYIEARDECLRAIRGMM